MLQVFQVLQMPSYFFPLTQILETVLSFYIFYYDRPSYGSVTNQSQILAANTMRAYFSVCSPKTGGRTWPILVLHSVIKLGREEEHWGLQAVPQDRFSHLFSVSQLKKERRRRRRRNATTLGFPSISDILCVCGPSSGASTQVNHYSYVFRDWPQDPLKPLI